MTEYQYHGYSHATDEGADNWHIPLEETIAALDADVILRGPAADRPDGEAGLVYLQTDSVDSGEGLYYHDGSSWTKITGSGGGSASVSDDGTQVLSSPGDLNLGNNLAVTDDGDGTVTIDASADGSALAISDDGTLIHSGPSDLDFRGGLTATDDGDGTASVELPQGDGSNLNADTVDGYHGSEFAAVTEPETITGEWELQSTTHISSTLDSYSSQDVAQSQDLWLPGVGEISNALRGKPVESVEYYDGSSWVNWSVSSPENINDGNMQTSLSGDASTSQFRVTFDVGAYQREFGLVMLWGDGGATFNDYTLTLERSDDKNSWTTQKDYQSISSSHWQEFFHRFSPGSRRYLRLTVNLSGVSSGDTWRLRDVRLLSADPGLNIDPIQYDGDNAFAKQDFDVRGDLSIQGTSIDSNGDGVVDRADTADAVIDSGSGETLDVYVQGSEPNSSDPYLWFDVNG